LFEAAWLDHFDVAFESGFFGQIRNRISDTFCEQRFAIDLFSRFLGVESEDCALGMNNAITDLYLLVLIHERFGDVRIVSVPGCGPANERRPIGNRFLLCRTGKVFSG
jgi:hypothetical protein